MTPKYIDIHSHINFKAFDEDGDLVLNRALDNDTWIINVGTQLDTSKKAIEVAEKYKEGVYAIIGLHPIHTGESHHDEEELGEGGKEFTSRGEIFNKDFYGEFFKNKKKNKKIVGIGECGLDYYRCTPESILRQKEAFINQIEFANYFNKPLMLHIRNNSDVSVQVGDKVLNAYADTIEILKRYAKVKGVVHFFEGSLENAKDFMALGFMISFTGAITYPPRKNGKGCNYVELIKDIPLNMILTDTDSPYMAPVPYRGKRNEPSYVKEIVKKIAEIKDLPEEEVAKAIVENARVLFNI
ncbi:MAG: TatD family hydrolase [bacterium]